MFDDKAKGIHLVIAVQLCATLFDVPVNLQFVFFDQKWSGSKFLGFFCGEKDR